MSGMSLHIILPYYDLFNLLFAMSKVTVKGMERCEDWEGVNNNIMKGREVFIV